jgi:hypothetical protein
MNVRIVDVQAGAERALMERYVESTACFLGKVRPPSGREELVIYGEGGLRGSTFIYVN